MKKVYFQEKITGEGTRDIYVVSADTDRTLYTYKVIDYSDDRGCMYVVHRAENPAKSLWCDNIVQALEICKADYKARVA